MILDSDTIVAIATPLGTGGLGVVRVSGPAAVSIADALFRGASPLSTASSHTLHHGWITDGDRPVDEAIASLFRAPRSYTGDDVVEFSCHGSPAVLTDIVRLCCAKGARPARPGEFTERAFLNGKMDLAQAEAVSALVAAGSRKSAAAAVEQLRGGLSAEVRARRARLIDALARLEANLDFAEEDVPPTDRDALRHAIEAERDGVDALLSTTVRGRILRDGLWVAFAGRPNVGKSSLFNALLSAERAIVTDVPGTTRDTLEEKSDWSGYPVVLVDTAGLRPTADPVERLGTERARSAQRSADVVILVVDAAAGVSEDDRAIARSLGSAPWVAALNKMDRGGGGSATLDGARALVPTSAVEKTGLESLKAAVLAAAPGASGGSAGVATVTQLRHARLLENARTRLEAALEALERGRSEEALSIDLRAAVDALGAITGETADEELLSSIFRQFCIGK